MVRVDVLFNDKKLTSLELPEVPRQGQGILYITKSDQKTLYIVQYTVIVTAEDTDKVLYQVHVLPQGYKKLSPV